MPSGVRPAALRQRRQAGPAVVTTEAVGAGQTGDLSIAGGPRLKVRPWCAQQPAVTPIADKHPGARDTLAVARPRHTHRNNDHRAHTYDRIRSAGSSDAHVSISDIE
jgi:hypothetical protein